MGSGGGGGAFKDVVFGRSTGTNGQTHTQEYMGSTNWTRLVIIFFFTEDIKLRD